MYIIKNNKMAIKNILLQGHISTLSSKYPY